MLTLGPACPENRPDEAAPRRHLGFQDVRPPQRGVPGARDHRDRRAQRQRQEQPRRRHPLGARRDQRPRAARRPHGRGHLLGRQRAAPDGLRGGRADPRQRGRPPARWRTSRCRSAGGWCATATASSASTATGSGCATSSGSWAPPGSPRAATPWSPRTTSTPSSRRPPPSAALSWSRRPGCRSLRAACEDALGRVGHAEVTLRRFEDLLAETEPQARRARGAGRAGPRAARAHRPAEPPARVARPRGLARGARPAAPGAAPPRLGGAPARGGRHRRGCVRGAGSPVTAHGSMSSAPPRGTPPATSRSARVLAERAAGDQQRSHERARAGVLARAVAVAELRTAARDAESAAEALAALSGAAAAALDVAGDLETRRRAAEQGRDAAADRSADRRGGAGRRRGGAARCRGGARRRRRRGPPQRRPAAPLQRRGELARGSEPASSPGRSPSWSVSWRPPRGRRDRATRAVADAEAALAADASALSGARARVDDTQGALDAARQAARGALARAAVLRGQVDGALGGRGAVAEAVAAGELQGRRLVDCFTVIDPADAAAVEAALEAHLGAWVVDDLTRRRRSPRRHRGARGGPRRR